MSVGQRYVRAMQSVSLTSPQVIDFGDPTIREAYRIWWHPYDMGDDFDVLTGRYGSVLDGDQIERRKLDPAYYRGIERAFASMRLTKSDGKRARRAKPEKRPARSTKRMPVRVVIRLTYPLTSPQERVVTIDRKYPGAIFGLAHDFYRDLYAQDEADGGRPGPSKGGPLLNRGFGPLVWGHDLGDLAFESCQYRAYDKARAKQLGAEGVFTFGIGS